MQGRIGLRTIRTSINYPHIIEVSLDEECLFWVRHTSKVGTGSSKLLSTLTDVVIAEKNIWEAATSNSPALSPKNDDSAERHDPEMDDWCTYAYPGINKGEVSSGIGGSPLLTGKLDDDAYEVVEACAVVIKLEGVWRVDAS